jgi:hypothetical protein
LHGGGGAIPGHSGAGKERGGSVVSNRARKGKKGEKKRSRKGLATMSDARRPWRAVEKGAADLALT